MAYSPPVMTLIFNKPGRRELREPISLVAAKRVQRGADTRFDLQRLRIRGQVTEATYPGNTCVSTPSLCNANFARS
jgi:hypothetical protein